MRHKNYPLDHHTHVGTLPCKVMSQNVTKIV